MRRGPESQPRGPLESVEEKEARADFKRHQGRSLYADVGVVRAPYLSWKQIGSQLF